MKYYYAFVEGRNFILEIDGFNQRVGFVTTFYFHADNDECIVSSLEKILQERIKDSRNIFFMKGRYIESFVTLNILEKSENEEFNNNDTGGFGFYNMTFLETVRAYLFHRYFLYFSKKIELEYRT